MASSRSSGLVEPASGLREALRIRSTTSALAARKSSCLFGNSA